MSTNHNTVLILKIGIGLIIFSVLAYVGWKLEKSHLKELEEKNKQEEVPKLFKPDFE
jgi:hypothetical protein